MKFTVELLIFLIFAGGCLALMVYNVRKELGPHQSRDKRRRKRKDDEA